MMSPRLSKTTNKIRPFIVMEIMEKATLLEKAGADIIHLEIGEPDFKTSNIVSQSGVKAIEKGLTGYTHSLGLISLRGEICKHYQKEYGVNINKNNVIISSGTSPLLLLSLATIVNSGDEVILCDPTYSCYPNFVHFLGGRCHFVKLKPDTGFAIDVKAIKKAVTKKTKALIINSPSNPTGLVISGNDLETLASLEIDIISDEIYHGLTYKDKAHSMLEYRDDITVINGFSKLYAMSGWRIGFSISDEKRVRNMQKMQQNFFISASNFGQRAALTALKNAKNFTPKMVETYNKRRKLLLTSLPKIGFKINAIPTGAFYILADARKFTKSSYNFALELLEKTHVALTPGIDFGQNAEGFIRFSYTNSYERIEEAIERLSKYLK